MLICCLILINCNSYFDRYYKFLLNLKYKITNINQNLYILGPFGVSTINKQKIKYIWFYISIYCIMSIVNGVTTETGHKIYKISLLFVILNLIQNVLFIVMCILRNEFTLPKTYSTIVCEAFFYKYSYVIYICILSY